MPADDIDISAGSDIFRGDFSTNLSEEDAICALPLTGATRGIGSTASAFSSTFTPCSPKVVTGAEPNTKLFLSFMLWGNFRAAFAHEGVRL